MNKKMVMRVVFYNIAVLILTVLMAYIYMINVVGVWYIPLMLSFTVISNLITWIITIYVWTFTKSAQKEIDDISKTFEDKLKSFGFAIDDVNDLFKQINMSKEDIEKIVNLIDLMKIMANAISEYNINRGDVERVIKLWKNSGIGGKIQF